MTERKDGDPVGCIPTTNPEAIAAGYTCKNPNPEHFDVCPDFAVLNALVERTHTIPRLSADAKKFGDK